MISVRILDTYNKKHLNAKATTYILSQRLTYDSRGIL